ncbi:MAG TPA: choice-of-anchor D domain-containing protein [Terriglobales bacterium]|nr:choice-of-anchor D domain-containing protein [Terriglobales bacterium]
MSSHIKARIRVSCWEAIAVFLALTILAGCQGLSAGGKSQTPAPQQNDSPGSLGVSPLTLDSGSVPMGSNKTLTVTATNNGTADITVSSVTFSAPQFTLSKPTIPVSIAAGQSATLSVVFAPTGAGSVAGSMTITSNASNSSMVVALQGAGVGSGQLSESPATLNFGSLTLGNNQTLAETLTNVGNSSVTISQATVTEAGFTLSGWSLPLTLAVGQSTNFNVVFAPQASGTVNGSVTVVSDAINSPLSLAISGTGLAPGSLAANPPSISFSNVQVGNNQSVSETLTNSSGSSVTITQATPTGSGFSVSGLNLPVTLAAGQGATFNVVFTPQSAGNVNGNLTVLSNASNPTLVVPLSGSAVEPGTLTPNPSSISFGSVQVGNNKSLTETVTNTGGSDVTISRAKATGTGFSINGISPPLTLTVGQSVTFNVVFTPLSVGSDSGNVAITSDASNPTLNISLSGTGTPSGQLAVNPTSLSFGNVVVGNSAQQTAQLVASGTTVIVSSVNISNADFTVSGLSFPVTIPAGQGVQFTVTFKPQSTGATSGTVSFTSNASNSPAVLSVSGTGTQPVQHSVALSWTASSSPNIDGYNIYRSGTSGGPYSKLNSSLNLGTTYTDNTVVDGSTYYYVTTAVNSGSQESTYSNQAQAVIP